jgi:hypothetical protein
MTTTIPEKCQACEVRDAVPACKWFLTYSKSLPLCKRCSRMLANRLPAIAKEVCMGKARKAKQTV